MKPRKIMIGTPIKGGVSATYLAGLVPLLQRKIEIARGPLELCILDGPSVNFARNELADHALKIGADELVFIDEDMGWHPDNFVRLLSHDVDIVASIYTKKKPGAPFYLLNLREGCDIDPATGLCEVNEIATGFMKIKTDVFRAIARKYPELEYYGNAGDDGQLQTAFELFPMGVVGPRSPRTRLEKIHEILGLLHHGEYGVLDDGAAALKAIEEIKQALTAKHDPGVLRGEDYYFCLLAREAGFKIYADFGSTVIPHIGRVAYPITPDKVGFDPKQGHP